MREWIALLIVPLLVYVSNYFTCIHVSLPLGAMIGNPF